MGKLQLNVDAVVGAARSAGASPQVIEGLRQRLETMNADNGVGLIDERATLALKVLDRHSGCVWESKEMTGEEREQSRAATRQALWRATELPLDIMVGNWPYVALFLEENLMGKAEGGFPLHPGNQKVNGQIQQVAQFMRGLGHTNAIRPRNFIPFYNAHRVAAVLTCPLAHCAEAFDCWETRRGFCRMYEK